jgi:hypothetical protein
MSLFNHLVDLAQLSRNFMVQDSMTTKTQRLLSFFLPYDRFVDHLARSRRKHIRIQVTGKQPARVQYVIAGSQITTQVGYHEINYHAMKLQARIFIVLDHVYRIYHVAHDNLGAVLFVYLSLRSLTQSLAQLDQAARQTHWKPP